MSRVRRLSVRYRWAIVLGATALSFAVSQRASAPPPGIPSRAPVRSELDALTVPAGGALAGHSRELLPQWRW